jgi:hypothetical protein
MVHTIVTADVAMAIVMATTPTIVTIGLLESVSCVGSVLVVIDHTIAAIKAGASSAIIVIVPDTWTPKQDGRLTVWVDLFTRSSRSSDPL